MTDAGDGVRGARFEEAPELLARYVKAAALHMLGSLCLVVAAFLVGAVWPHGYLSWESLAVSAERWAATASRLALPVLGIVVGLLLPLYLAPLGSKDLERKASTEEDSLTATDHEVLAIQDVRENLILLLATVGAVSSWWMFPAALNDPIFGLLVMVLAMVFGSLATIREATFGRAAMHVLRSHRAKRGLTRLLERNGVDPGASLVELESQIARARRLEWLFVAVVAIVVPMELWFVGRGIGFDTPFLDTGVVSIVVVPYLIWRWTGTRRSRIRRARVSGSRDVGPDLVGASLAVLLDLVFLTVTYVLVRAAAESHLAAVLVVALMTVLLVVLVRVLPRYSRIHRLLLIDAALRARHRAVGATAPL